MRATANIYPHANTIVAIEESRLLKQFEYEVLYNANGLQATLDELNSINYFRSYKIAQPHNYNEILDELMEDTFQLIRDIAPTELIWRIFALYYDIHNMKLMVKERFLGRRLGSLALSYGSYSLPTIRSAAVRESDNILENEILTAGYFEALHVKDMYDIDFVLDKTYFRTLKDMAGQFKIPEIAAFVVERVDLYNASAYFQAMATGSPEEYFAKAFSDQGSHALEEWQAYVFSDRREKFGLWQKYRPIWQNMENRSDLFADLDVLIDNHLIGKTKCAKLLPFGVVPICAYFFNKLMEMKNIKILLTGKENFYGTAEIRRRMRIPYEL